MNFFIRFTQTVPNIFNFKFYRDPALKPFFMGKLANLIFFDLLYKRQEYSKLLKYFDSLRKELESKEQLITRSIFVIAFATCYNQVGSTITISKHFHELIKKILLHFLEHKKII